MGPCCDTDPMRRLRRWLTVWVVPLLVIAGSVAAVLYFWGRFPDPLAVHWGFSGDPDGNLPIWLYAVGMYGGMLLAWYGLISGSRGGLNAPLASVVYFILGLLASVNALVIYFNLDAATWEDATSVTSLAVGTVLLIALLIGGLGWLLAGGKGAVPEDVAIDPVTTNATTWSGAASNLWIGMIAALPMVLVFVLDPIWAALMVVIAILLVIFAFVRVDATERGVTVALGPLGIPRRRFSMDSITGAGAIEITPLAYGGWGWRMRSGRRAYTIRGGPAIRIERSNGVAIVVTVDDAPTGAAVIDSLATARKYGSA